MSAPPSIPALDDTLGAIEIGGFCGAFLFGIVTLQIFHYYRLFPDDPVLLKLTVASVWVLELGHTIATSHLLYALTVTFYAQPQHINNPPRSLEMTILFSAPIYFIVQIFFANRIRALSGRWEITIICWILTFTRAVCTFAMLAVTLNLAQFSDLEVKFPWLMANGLSLGVGVDVIVAISMCYYLSRLRTSVQSTRRMMDTLIVWTIETGMATGGTSVLLLLLLFVRNDLSWFPFYLILAKSFSNSFLASLNGRQRFRGANRELVDLNTGPNQWMGLEITTSRMPEFTAPKDTEARACDEEMPSEGSLRQFDKQENKAAY